MADMKVCTTCGEEKALSAFYKERWGKHGVRSKCIDCLTNGLPPGPIPVDITTRYEVDANGCWIWTGSKSKQGYGRIKWRGKGYTAHRAMYEHLVGEIPEGLVLDHTCNVKSCVNPDHLDPVTNAVNLARAYGRGHCAGCRCEELGKGTVEIVELDRVDA